MRACVRPHCTRYGHLFLGSVPCSAGNENVSFIYCSRSPESASPYVSYFISDDSEEQIVGRRYDDVLSEDGFGEREDVDSGGLVVIDRRRISRTLEPLLISRQEIKWPIYTQLVGL